MLNDFASEMVVPLIPLLLATMLAAGPVALGLIEGVADKVAVSREAARCSKTAISTPFATQGGVAPRCDQLRHTVFSPPRQKTCATHDVKSVSILAFKD